MSLIQSTSKKAVKENLHELKRKHPEMSAKQRLAIALNVKKKNKKK